jgi:hypothetical protein
MRIYAVHIAPQHCSGACIISPVYYKSDIRHSYYYLITINPFKTPEYISVLLRDNFLEDMGVVKIS